MVVAALLNVGASVMTGGAGSGAVDFFHGFQVALMMTIMFNLVQFVYWRCNATRTGSCLQKHKPTLLMLCSAIMTVFQPMAILVVGSWNLLCCACEDIGIEADKCPASGRSFPPFGPEARECHGDGNWFWKGTTKRCTGQELALFPNQTMGWLIQIFMTYGGFAVMFVAVVMATQMDKKIKNKWHAVRRVRQNAA